MPLRSSASRLFGKAREFVTVSADFYICAAAGILLLPLPWLGAWLLSTLTHELCHYIALRACGCCITGIRISLKGVFMETDGISLGKEAVCAYAGPLGALLLLFFTRQLPRTAICVLVQSIYNLLPVFPLDGGRGLGCLLRKLLGEDRGEETFRAVETAVLILLILLALYAVVKLGLGLLPALAVVLLIIKNKKINIPCKKMLKGLQ